MVQVQYTGIKQFSEGQQASINTLTQRYAQKLDRYYPNATARVVLKTLRNKGTRQRTDVTIRLNAPKTVAQAQGSDWDPAKAVHATLAALELEIKKLIQTQAQKTKVVKNQK